MDLDDDYEEEQIEDYEEDLEEDDEEEENDGDPPKMSSILDILKNNRKGMYFDEELVKGLIVEQYQPFLDYEINEKGKRVCVNRERASKEVEKEIMANLYLIANAIINKYRYWRFEPLEDLQAEALKAMWYYLPNFVPGKGSAFDLFSIICKRHLLNFTLKNYKHRIAGDIDVCYDVSTPDETNYPLLFDTLEKTFLKIINRHYIGKKRKKYIELTSILMEYIVKNGKIVGKNDLLSAFKEYGYKSAEYKKFIEELMMYKEEFFDSVR
jgi:hypothetical protein